MLTDDLATEWLRLQFLVRNRLRYPTLERNGYSERITYSVFPAFEDCVSVFVMTSSDSASTIAVRSRWNRDCDHAVFQSPTERIKHPETFEPTIASDELSVSASKLDSLIESTQRLSLPIDPAYDGLGCDGVTYELRFGHGFFFSRLQWWVKLPKRWKTLEPLITKLDALIAAPSASEGKKG